MRKVVWVKVHMPTREKQGKRAGERKAQGCSRTEREERLKGKFIVM